MKPGLHEASVRWEGLDRTYICVCDPSSYLLRLVCHSSEKQVSDYVLFSFSRMNNVGFKFEGDFFSPLGRTRQKIYLLLSVCH
jgi:hypothetical protein